MVCIGGVERGRAEREQRQTAAFRTPSSGTKRAIGEARDVRFSTLDPFGVAMMGFGVLVVAVLAFVF